MSEKKELNWLVIRREVMEMADHDIRVDEIARKLNIPEETVKIIIREEVNK